MAAEPLATGWNESIAAGESAKHDRLAHALREVQRARAKRAAHGRALHYKAHAGLASELVTLPDLPEWARVGIFAEPARFSAYVRFSNGAGWTRPDSTPDVRGIAVKVVGVPGRKLIEALSDAATQDFLGILTPTLPFRDPAEFVGVVLAVSGSPVLLLPRLVKLLGFRTFPMLRRLRAGLRAPVDSLAQRTFFSAAPIRWGTTAVKYSLAPRAVPEIAAPIDVGAADRLARDLASRLERGPIVYELRIQRFVDAEKTPIEDTTREWTERDSPWVAVATLTIPQQDPLSARGRKIAAFVETLSFDPWHATDDFRPLGAIMRARRAAYRDSALERAAAPEPDGTERWE